MCSAVSKKLKTVYIAYTRGCPRIRMDIAWLFHYFYVNNWRIAKRIQQADLIIAAGCAFDRSNEEQSVRLLRIINNKRKKKSQLVVAGCIAGINPGRVSREFGAMTITPAEITKLDELISADTKLEHVPPVNYVEPGIHKAISCFRLSDIYPQAGWSKHLIHGIKKLLFPVLSSVAMEKKVLSALCKLRQICGLDNKLPDDRCFRIQIARGCLDKCTFCAIRFAAGELRSKSLYNVLAEFDNGLKQGYRLFEILAGDIGPYGRDIGKNIIQLFRALFTRRQEYRLILTDINPRYLIHYTSQMTELLAKNGDKIALMKVPIQSGSDRILGLMKRGYTAADTQDCLCQIKKAAPNISIETHVLVGFPSETEDDFRATVELLRVVKFSHLQIYGYTDRPKTVAAGMTPKVPQETINRRVQYLRDEFS